MTRDTSPNSSNNDRRPNLVVRIVDRCIVAAIRLLITLAHLKSRDPRERTSNLFKPDAREKTHIRNWQGVLQWQPTQRVGCFAGVFIGIVIGATIIWYNLR